MKIIIRLSPFDMKNTQIDKEGLIFMRICMLVTSNVIKDPRVQREAKLAHDNGFEVFVLGRRDRKFNQNLLEQLPYKVILADVNRNDNDNVIKRIFERLSIGFSFVAKCIKLRPDIIHANDFDTLPFAFIASLFTCSKIVYDSHEIYTENCGLAKRKLLKKIIKLFEKFLIKKSHMVVSVSNAAAKKLSEMYGIEEPLVVTNCSYSAQIKQPVIKNNKFEVLYHGIFGEGRGYEEFVESAEYLPDDISLVVRGYGPIEQKLHAIAENEKIRDKVIFAKPVEINELIKCAAKSHVGVVLTKPVSINFEYTVSNKLFEYIQAGIPLILSGVKEHRYLVEKYGIGIIIDKVEPKCIAEAIMKLYNDPMLYEKLRNNVLNAAKIFKWETEGMKLIKVYNRLLHAG